MEKVKDYKDLKVWQLATELIVKIYKLLDGFPKEEKFRIISQAKDSTESHIIIGEKLGFIKKNHQSLYKEILKYIKNLSVKINNYIRSINNQIMR